MKAYAESYARIKQWLPGVGRCRQTASPLLNGKRHVGERWKLVGERQQRLKPCSEVKRCEMRRDSRTSRHNSSSCRRDYYYYFYDHSTIGSRPHPESILFQQGPMLQFVFIWTAAATYPWNCEIGPHWPGSRLTATAAGPLVPDATADEAGGTDDCFITY